MGVGFDCVGGIVFPFVGAGGGEVCGGFLSSKNLMFIPILKAKAKSKGKLGTITGVCI